MGDHDHRIMNIEMICYKNSWAINPAKKAPLLVPKQI